ncbi:single-stranded DNA-binding protein [Bifidobacterium sp. ESL0704]|uniref:single-stranded DNA-binding protein n=1 Tax=Bifidobacterium sp. ESL0704 TaxID=2983219 RepID=UPI0023F930BC|nr:single-stranded DNA-binding protein [Bifidobacterium sp. ESL0704]WEV52504.1 single-stranded DNA-binding protein [Bifidobacterium sp. ESL0704]
MAQQGTVTISGFMGANPQSFGREGGPAAASFRIGCTTRYFNPAVNEWRDRPTTWINVKVFRQLAENVLSSLKKGDPVIATGNLATEEWTRDGTKHSRMVMEATSVGHDLSFGISVFQRVRPGAKGQEGTHEADSPRPVQSQHEAGVGEGGSASVSGGGDDGDDGEKPDDRQGGAAAGGASGHNHGSTGDGAGEDPWDASEVFEGHATADRLVASVG